jgi:osmoprotectant transport system permease protein
VTALLAAAGPVIPDFGGSSSCVRNNDTFCWDWFKDNWSDTFAPRLVQHIWLTLIAIAIGCVIAFAIALVAYRRNWVELPFVLLAGFLYTIPSLALFQLLVPVSGLTRLTVEIALVSYTLLILFRNMLIGLRNVPDEVRDAARGMGLTRRQTLWRVELPLALPAILAGVQIAAVTVISLATVAAFVVDEGLGSPIFDAINRGTFKTELIAAAVMAIGLGFVAYALLALLQRVLTPWVRARAT